MSRSNYVEDYDHMNLYRSAVERAIKGKRGQAFLKELAASLDAMPDKRLISYELISKTGEVCAIGAYCKAKGIDVRGVDVEDPDMIGRLVGISRSMAAEIEYENDEVSESQTPEQRWIRMRKWIAASMGESK